MSDTFTLKGSYTVIHGATDTDPSADFDISSSFNEVINVKRKLAQTISLDADTAETVSLGDLAQANVVLIRASQDVKVALTSSHGSLQLIPAGKVCFIMATVAPITVIQITRQAGISTIARIVLCELQP